MIYLNIKYNLDIIIDLHYLSAFDFCMDFNIGINIFV